VNRVAAAVGLGLLGGLAWWAPMVSLAALPVAVGVDDPRDPAGPAIRAGALAVAAAVALAAAPWLAVPRPAEERLILALCFGVLLALAPRVWSAGGVAMSSAMIVGLLGVLFHARVLPAAWVGTLGGALGLAIPGLPWRSPSPLGLIGVAAWAAWPRVGPRLRPIWLGLAFGSAVAAWPFQAAAPPRLDGWYLGVRPTPSMIAAADPRCFPREFRPAAGVLPTLAAVALGFAVGMRRDPATWAPMSEAGQPPSEMRPPDDP
jgi:hypothetical protein